MQSSIDLCGQFIGAARQFVSRLLTFLVTIITPPPMAEKEAENFAFLPSSSNLPKRIDIEIPAEAMEYLTYRSKKSGRSIDELILEILDAKLSNDNLSDQ